VYHAFGVVEDNVFYDNQSAKGGGAIAAQNVGGSGDFTVRRNWFGGNFSTTDGGALHISAVVGATPQLANNTFVDNQARRGAHLYIYRWPGAIVSNIFSHAWSATGGVSAENWSSDAERPIFTYNDAYYNFPDYAGALTSLVITGQDGNLAVDPGYADQCSILISAGPCCAARPLQNR